MADWDGMGQVVSVIVALMITPPRPLTLMVDG